MSFFRRVGNLVKGQIAEKRKNNRVDPEVEEELSGLRSSKTSQTQKPMPTEKDSVEEVEDIDLAAPSKKRTL